MLCMLQRAEINCQVAVQSEIVWISMWAGYPLHITESKKNC